MKRGQPKKQGGFLNALNLATSRQKVTESTKTPISPEDAVASFQGPIEWFAQQVALMNHGNVTQSDEPAKQIFNINGGMKTREEEPVQMGQAVIEEPQPELPAAPVDPIQAMRERLGGKKR